MSSYDELVFVGAWCHRLLQFHSLAHAPSFAPLMTEDTDVAVPEKPRNASPPIDEALKAAGFVERLSGSGPKPSVKYHLDDDDGLYVEFIAPLRGSGHTRDGEPDDLLRIAGITAQKLRHVDLLLFEPWRCELAKIGIDVGHDTTAINVANPASYLAQKLLTLKKRANRRKLFKDVLYVHDTLLLFGDSFEQLREQGARVLGLLSAKTQRELQSWRVEFFRDETLLNGAAEIAGATGRPRPQARDVAAICTVGLERIFAP